MKVFIFTEGGKNIGFGHISRCMALQQAFEDRSLACKLVVNADDKAGSILQGSNHRIFDWLFRGGENLEDLGGADLVIIDSYLADLDLYKKLAGLAPNAVYIDDYQRLDYPKGVVLNSTVYANQLDYPRKEGVAYLLGPEYVFLRKEFWDLGRKEIKESLKNVLITFGGTDSELVQGVSNHLKKKFNFSFTSIDKNNRVGSGKFIDLMLESDLCISAGGQTTYELARCGIPTIGVCLADNQLLNLEAWQKTGFLEFAGWHNCKNLLERISESIIKLIDYNQRAKCSSIGRKYVDGQGARRVIGEILSYAKN